MNLKKTFNPVITILAAMFNSAVAFAQSEEKMIDTLLPKPGKENIDKYEEIKAVGDLPILPTQNIVGTAIRAILGWSMLFTIIALVVAGIFYLTSQGKEEELSKAKSVIIYLIIGMAIMAGSYGIVIGLSQFDFFE